MGSRMSAAPVLAIVLVLAPGLAGESAAGNGKAVPSQIVHVTVYPDWAYVTRQAETDIPAGPVRLCFKDLPSWIDDDSIRVRVEAGEGCTIAGASTRTTFLARSSEEDVRKAEEEVTALRDRIEDIRGEIGVLGKDREFISQLTVWKLDKIPHERAAREIDVEEIRKVKTFIVEELKKNSEKTAELSRSARDLEPELRAKEKEWQQLRSRARLEKKDILVDLEAEKQCRARVFVSYLITGASWYPAYDARTDADKERMEFSAKAVVQQTTGEDWSDAKFTLSTVQPHVTREKPELNPWYVTKATAGAVGGGSSSASFGYRTGGGKKAAKLQQVYQARLNYNMTDVDAQVAWDNWQPNRKRAMEVVRQVEERGTTVEFDVTGRFAVKADGRPVRMAIGQVGLNAERHYSAVPAVSKSTYVSGEMRNTGNFPFLPGLVKVYIEGSFIGKSKIGCVAAGEKFQLYLGLEERIKVIREIDARKSSTSRTGSTKRLRVAYTIVIKSFLKTPAQVEVSEQIPVSQDSAVKVRMLSVEPRTDDIEKGIIRWPVVLAPEQSAELKFGFQMDYPADVYLRHAAALEAQVEGF